jgi:hypothetical protein
VTRYAVTVTREGRWLVIQVPALEIATQAKRPRYVEATARDLIATYLEVPIETVAVDATWLSEEETW